jgi:O-antigen/teichoic acid export membrane protein
MTARLRDKGFGIGALAVSGVAAYLFLALGARALGPAHFGPLGTLWSVVFLATAAVAAPLETELARRVGAARGRGAPYGRDVAAALILAGSVGSIALVLAIVGGPWVDDRLFAGAPGYSVAGAVAFAGLLAGGVAKGACAGSGRLAWWGAYLLADGGSRCLLALAATLIAPSPMAFAAALAVGPWLAMIVISGTLRKILEHSAGLSRHLVRDLVTRTSPLLVGAAAASGLTYLGAVMLPALVPGPDARVGSYVAALSLARLPLFALSPLVAIAVPWIAFEIGRGASREASRGVVALVGFAAAAGSLTIVAAHVAGAGALATLFGPGFALAGPSLLALAIAAAAWLVTTAAAAALVAAGRAQLAAAGWCAGILVAASVGLATADPFVRTDLAVTAGAVAAAITTLVAVRLVVTPRLRTHEALAT